MHYKALSFREFQKVLKKNGYQFVRQTGGHYVYHGVGGRQLVINDKLKQSVIIHLVKEYELVW